MRSLRSDEDVEAFAYCLFRVVLTGSYVKRVFMAPYRLRSLRSGAVRESLISHAAISASLKLRSLKSDKDDEAFAY